MLDVALKEWSVVCDFLLEGRLSILLRKGGIHEYKGPGRFELEHERFALYPAWEHQRPEGIRPELRGRVEVFDEEPREVPLKGYAVVTEDAIWQVPGRAAFDTLADLHVWDTPQIDMRFNYKPDRPLYLIAPRVYRLPRPKVVPNRDDYRGCRSWVPLHAEDVVDDAAGQAVLADDAYARVLERVNRAFASVG